MKRTWLGTLLAVVLLYLGLSTFWHLPEAVPWGPPILPEESLRVSPAVATTILFLISMAYGVALLSAAYSLFRIRAWARIAYLAAAALFLTDYISLFAFVKSPIPSTTFVLVLLGVFLPVLGVGWWIATRQVDHAHPTITLADKGSLP